jgi:hypothetical protein
MLAFLGVIAPQLGVMLIFVSGLGFVLLLAPSLWLYVTAALPGIYLWRHKQKRILGSLVSITCVFLLALTPPYIASLKAKTLITSATSNDLSNLDSFDYATDQIIIVEEVERLRAPFGLGKDYNVPCLRLCQRLLLEGMGGDRGIFIAIKGNVGKYRRNPFQSKGSFYRIENRSNCPQRYTSNQYEVFIESYQMAAKGKCIVRYSSSIVPDGLVFDEQIIQNDSLIPKLSLAYPTNTKKLEVTKTIGDQKQLLVRSTSIRVRKATYPTLVSPSASLLHSVTALSFFSNYDEKQSIDIVDIFEEFSNETLIKDIMTHRNNNSDFDSYYFKLGKSKHQLPPEFNKYFKLPADETFIAP